MKKSNLLAALLVLALTSMPLSAKENDNTGTLVLSSDNVIILNAQVDGDSTAAVISKAKELDGKLSGSLKGHVGLNNDKPLYLFLNTPGGSIQSGLELIEALKGLGRPVNTVTLFAASMGFQIAQNLDRRYILKNGVLMSHRASGQFEGQFGGKAPSQIDSRYHLWLTRLTEMDEQTVKRTNGKQTLESYQNAYASELWLTGTESVEKGYADSAVTVKCDSSLTGVSPHEVNFLGMLITYDLDNCPINTAPMNIRMNMPVTERVNIDGKIQTKVVMMDFDKFVQVGGGYGQSCLTSNANVCSADPYLTAEHVIEVKDKFVDNLTKKKVVYMYW